MNPTPTPPPIWPTPTLWPTPNATAPFELPDITGAAATVAENAVQGWQLAGSDITTLVQVAILAVIFLAGMYAMIRRLQEL